MWKMDPISGFDIRPETVHCSTKDVYTSEITFLASQSLEKTFCVIVNFGKFFVHVVLRFINVYWIGVLKHVNISNYYKR